MSSSNSNLPVIILVVIAILALGGFYYADRSSSPTPDMAAITDSADPESMAKSKQKYQANKSAYSHSGFNGSAEDYLNHINGGMKPAEDVKKHSGYSGNANEYLSKHSSDDVAMLESNAENHSGFSGSMKDYAKGKFDTRSAPSSTKPSQSSKATPKSSNGNNTSSHTGHTGSVDDYLNKYK